VTQQEIGLIVNPIAGIGGAVGLKGSDGVSIQQQALALGAQPTASIRTEAALVELARLRESLSFVTYPGEMGEDIARKCHFRTRVIGSIESGNTKASDTQMAAGEMSRLGVPLILFAGGDGTARDIASNIHTTTPVVGIPSGVKMHSAVFANRPRDAGNLARLFLEGRITRYHDAEVMDLDEESYRRGIIRPRLFGFLRVPSTTGLIQSRKRPSSSGDSESQAAIARGFCMNMESGIMYVLGPGSTTKAIADQLGLEKTLIGVDVIENGELVQVDANENQLLSLLEGRSALIIVSPIGGQGHLFGRGNQQISHRVIDQVGTRQIVVVCTPDKLHSLEGRPLQVDSGDEGTDARLSGYLRVVTGFNEYAVYRVKA
jgi:predicted polyphosphate/ATP-dependent NAD kinase